MISFSVPARRWSFRKVSASIRSTHLDSVQKLRRRRLLPCAKDSGKQYPSTFRSRLNSDGQHLALSLDGPGANSFVLRTTDGELTQENGGFSLVIPEGERHLMVELRAKDEISSTSSLSLSVELTTPDGDPTHEKNVEASITLTDSGEILNGDFSVINYVNGQQTISWVGDNDNNEPIFNAGANHMVYGNGGYGTSICLRARPCSTTKSLAG